MGNRIHPLPGEPFCPSCHADADDEDCTPEHDSYCSRLSIDLGDTGVARAVAERDALAAELAECKAKLVVAERVNVEWRDDMNRESEALSAARAEVERLRSALKVSEDSAGEYLEDAKALRAECERLEATLRAASIDDACDLIMETWDEKLGRCMKERDAAVAECERLTVLHKIDCEENEGLANDIGGWVKETNKLRALVGELVEALEERERALQSQRKARGAEPNGLMELHLAALLQHAREVGR